MTTAELLAKLNSLRANANKPPLKAWKESRAKLEAAVAALTPAMPAEVITAAEEPAANVAASVPKASKAVRPGNAFTVTLANIARELNLQPKIARAKMRRIRLPEGVEVSKHTYAVDHKQTVIDMLKKDFRRK